MLLSKSSDQQLVKIFGFLLVFLLLCFSIANNSFKNGKFTCNKYILNTYLYIVLTFNIIILLTLGLEYGNFSYQMSLLGLLGLFLVSIGCIFLMHSINPEKVLLKHFVWLAFVLIIGFIFYPLYIISDKGVVISAMFTTLSLTIFLSLIRQYQ